jgi:hypothetical protein
MNRRQCDTGVEVNPSSKCGDRCFQRSVDEFQGSAGETSDHRAHRNEPELPQSTAAATRYAHAIADGVGAIRFRREPDGIALLMDGARI